MHENQITHLSANQSIAFTQIDDDVVLMGPDNGRFYGINALGAEIWNLLLSEKCTIDSICEHIMLRYDIDNAQCMLDVRAFLDTMHAEGFITLTESPC